MRKLLLIIVSIFFIAAISAQNGRPYIPKSLKDYGVPGRDASDDPASLVVKQQNSFVKSGTAVSEETIGETRYDLQTNASVQNRLYYYPDGTFGATWTFGLLDAASFSDRGTAYNYFDGTSWGAYPSARVETNRAGWPSYAPWGDGEIICSHISVSGSYGLLINRRNTKGTGTWSETLKTGPGISPRLLWPRMVTNGTNHQTMHLMVITAPTGNSGVIYNGMDGALLYYRSQDGGVTWDIEAVQPTGVDSSVFTQINGDTYAWAEPKGNTLAFVCSDAWYDMFLLKSTDNGSTWTKTTIWEHPYPKFDPANLIATDTFYGPDGSNAVVLDDNGVAHVFFGVNRAHCDGSGTFWFPFVDGIGYWNETMPPFTSPNFKYTMDPDSLYATGNLVGWTQDVNGNDTLDFLPGSIDVIGRYYLSLSSFPNVTMDENGDMYLVYSSVTEGYDNTIQNFRHIWGRAYFEATGDWSEFRDLTGSIIHNFDECVFPSLAANSDDNFYMLYQADEEPGLNSRGDEDPPTDNSIIFSAIPKSDFGVGMDENFRNISYVSQNYPNPFTTSTMIVVNLTRPTKLSLEVYSLTGQLMHSIDKGNAAMGYHTINLDGSNYPPGIYFAKVTAGNQSVTKRMIKQ